MAKPNTPEKLFASPVVDGSLPYVEVGPDGNRGMLRIQLRDDASTTHADFAAIVNKIVEYYNEEQPAFA